MALMIGNCFYCGQQRMVEGVTGGRFQDVKVKLLCGDMAVFKAPEEGLVEISREMKRKRTV